MNVGLAIKYASVGLNRGIFGIDRGIFDTQPRTSTEAYLILNRGILVIVLNFSEFHYQQENWRVSFLSAYD